MNNKENSTGQLEKQISNRQLERIIKISLICGIIIVSGFVIYYILFPEEGYVGFGILNEDKKAEDYPTTAAVNETISFYVTVENQLDHNFTFKVIIFLGDENTKLSSKGHRYANKTDTTEKVTLDPKKDWISDKLSVSFPQNGTDKIIIAELWKYNQDNSREFWDILYLRLTIIG
jgi:uncharacterized membrane protein